MSNHITASWGKLFILKYINGINTLVPVNEFNEEYAVKVIKESIKNAEREHTVRKIDSCLNNCLFTSQYFLPENFKDFSIGKVIEVEKPYDYGENETIKDIKKYYSNYKEIEVRLL